MLVQLTQDPLEAERLVRVVRTDASGAVTLFYGVVRNHNEGRGVLFLEYEAYPELAERQLRAVGEEILQRFSIDDIAIAHRTGRLEIGETSLLVAVASAHRAQAFAACHAAVDRIKETVPIWKKEHWAGGGVWLEGTPVATPEQQPEPAS
ncbi:MAG TPA: molybdenum cofactor biosynthesis protein MoaE [Dehalococcoidia bacterium]|nr:molybdenum cofactor biosynthesis protein MoaE [Dehalococcoidia bacterium]